MRWLIVEDSLEGHGGHWLNYITGFCRELTKLGDSVELLVSHRAQAFIVKELGALPVLPGSVYLKKDRYRSKIRRFTEIPIHAWKTFYPVRRYLKKSKHPDVVFVPTVSIHHLLAWVIIIKLRILPPRSRLLLFFPSLPLQKCGNIISPDGSPTAKWMAVLIYALRTESSKGQVILGVETTEMKRAAEKLFQATFTYFPHPVLPIDEQAHNRGGLLMACYGVARHEKGSDLFAEAIARYLTRYPDSSVRFAFQWIDDFSKPDRSLAAIPETLQNDPRVEIIARHFDAGEYTERLSFTDLIVLPYLTSSYEFRLSRVVLEAITNGIPVVVTEGTTLATQAKQYGSAIFCTDGDVESLVNAIRQAEENLRDLKMEAQQQKQLAQTHFSVATFREIIKHIITT